MGRIMKIKFDPTINVGALLTIGGLIVTLLVGGVTTVNLVGSVDGRQKATDEKLALITDRVGAVQASVARMEGRFDVLIERRRADLGNPTTASMDGP